MSKRKFNNVYINIGLWACLLSALLNIASCILSFTTGSISGYSIFNYCWNAVFYLIIGNYFYRSKNSYYGRVMYAVLILAICTYIIPAIINLVEGLLGGGIEGLLTMILMVCSSMLVGIIYSVALILYNKKQSKGRYTFLLVMGIILFVLCVAQFCVVDAPYIVTTLNTMLSNISAYSVQQIIIVIFLGIEYIIGLLFGFVYFYTPLFFKNK